MSHARIHLNPHRACPHSNSSELWGTACYFHSAVREKWRCQSPNLSESSHSQALNSTNPPLEKYKPPLVPITSLSQSMHTFWTKPPWYWLIPFLHLHPNKLWWLRAYGHYVCGGLAGIMPRSSVLLAGLPNGWRFFISVYCNVEPVWDWSRERSSHERSVSKSWSWELVVTLSKIWDIGTSRP